jgi:hypothetical protein
VEGNLDEVASLYSTVSSLADRIGELENLLSLLSSGEKKKKKKKKKQKEKEKKKHSSVDLGDLSLLGLNSPVRVKKVAVDSASSSGYFSPPPLSSGANVTPRPPSGVSGVFTSPYLVTGDVKNNEKEKKKKKKKKKEKKEEKEKKY